VSDDREVDQIFSNMKGMLEKQKPLYDED